MMKLVRLLVAALLLVPACRARDPNRPAGVPRWERLAGDRVVTFASGSRFLAPRGWWLEAGSDRRVLEDPERELRVVLLELRERDPVMAIAAAWQRVRPGFARGVQQTLRPPPRDGWEAIAQIVYETGTQEARAVMAVARVRKGTAYVALIDGRDAAVGRRGAQTSTTLQSWKPPDLVEESFRGRQAHAFSGDRVRALEDFVERGMRLWRVPGAALAVMQDGKVVYERGFGVRELGKSDPVTPATLFLIGSVTKSLTSLLVAALVDDGKLSWETPLARVLPEFALADPGVTRAVQMRHGLCACTGMPRQDMEFLFEYEGVTPEQRIASMATMKPTTGFGETFQYSNLMVSAAGYAAGRAVAGGGPLGPAYDAAIRARILEPLGMTQTTFDFDVAARRERASPHGEDYLMNIHPLPLGDERFVIPVRPAGGAWSSVRDLARWVLAELGEGRTPEGRQVVSRASLARRREPMARIDEKAHYGLGLVVQDEHGLRIVGHGGATVGFSAAVFWLPEHGIGAAFLTNARAVGPLGDGVRRKLLELLFEGRDEAEKALAFARQAREERFAIERKKIRVPPDRAWMARFVGRYTNAALGRISVREEAGAFVLDAGEWKSPVGQKRQRDGGQLLILLGPTLVGLELIAVEKDGKPELILEAGQQKHVFRRVAGGH